MAWRVAGSLIRLRDQINAFAPNRSKASDGTIGDAAHAGSASDHNPNSAGVVCALDITHHPAGGLDAHRLADHLISNRNSQLKYVVSNRRIASALTGWRWIPYNGSNPHTSHIHISVGIGNDGASRPPYDGTQDWSINYNGATTPPPSGGGNGMTDDNARQISFHYLGRHGRDGRPNGLQAAQPDVQAYPLTAASLNQIFLSTESRQWRDTELPALFNERDSLRVTNKNFRDAIARLEKDLITTQNANAVYKEALAVEEAKVRALTNENKALSSEVIKLTQEIESIKKVPDFNGFGKFLWSLIIAIGTKTSKE